MSRSDRLYLRRGEGHNVSRADRLYLRRGEGHNVSRADRLYNLCHSTDTCYIGDEYHYIQLSLVMSKSVYSTYRLNQMSKFRFNLSAFLLNLLLLFQISKSWFSVPNREIHSNLVYVHDYVWRYAITWFITRLTRRVLLVE